MASVDLVGQRFGRWQVLELSSARYQDRWTQWICRCDCGTLRAVRTSDLRLGKSKSCGCVSAEKARARGYGSLTNLTNRKFGRLKVIAFAGRKQDGESLMTRVSQVVYQQKIKRARPVWRCRCDCGNEVVVRHECLIHGHTRSCGCFHKEDLAARTRAAYAALKIITSTQNAL